MTVKQKATQLALTLVGEGQNPKPLIEVLMEMARWQREQILKQAVDATIPIHGQIWIDNTTNYKAGEKVKILIIKED